MKKFWIIALLLCIAVYCCGHFPLDGDKKKPEGTLERIDDLNASRYCVGLPLGGKAMMVGEEQFVDVFLEFPCFFYDPKDVGNLISRSSAFAKSSLFIWKFLVHVLLKPRFANARLCYFNSPGTAYDAILQRKADAFLFNSHSLDFISVRHPDLEVLPGVLDRVDLPLLFLRSRETFATKSISTSAGSRKMVPTAICTNAGSSLKNWAKSPI